ncbi:DNA/RNA non-specific endonuclease [Robertmurraya sp. DFI.2.37]|uniref:DNA/RNA non-specific endonuclease n=1 Tax=Robertmurraya sp. DFI.2.37 TaxID=3031819 RepID=UPI0034D95C0C
MPIPNLERFLSYSLSSVQSNLEEQGLTTNPAATANDSVHETEANWRGWLSGGLDFIPGISNIKSGIEAMTGKDFITGRDIGHLERGVLLAAIFGGPIAKGGVKVFKWGGKQLDKIKHVLNPDKVMETGKAVLAKVKQGFNSLRNTAAGLMKKIADTPLPTPQFAMAGGAKMPQATIGDAVNSAKNSVMNFAQKVKDGVGKGAGNRSARESDVKTLVGRGEQYTNGRKNRLKPDIRYKTGEYNYFYETDSAGRIVKFETENLQLTTRTDRLSHSKNTPGKIKGQDHAGHLAGDRFGGSPKIDNLVSQLSEVNLKQYKKIEDEWAAALKETPPKEVTINLEVIYSGNNVRPEKFIVKYTIDGELFSEVLLN